MQYAVTGIVGGEIQRNVDQRAFSSDIQDAGVGWQDLGFVTVDAQGTITVTLSDKNANGIVTADSIRIEKVDSVLSIADVTVNEDAGTALVTVTSSQAVGSEFSVEFATGDGTAAAGTEYAQTIGTLEFSGEIDGESQTIEFGYLMMLMWK